MSDVTSKIAKLLALAQSPVEAEAKAALLKARQLMAEHKLRPEDIAPQENTRLIRAHVGISSTKLSTPWAITLSDIIAKHYCCGTYRTHTKGRKAVEIGFVGLEEDFAACKLAFCYAHGSVMARCGEIKTQYKGIYPPGDIRQMCHSYGWGFCSGLSEAFTSQSQEHQDWGLVMVVPKAVEDVLASMEKSVYAAPNKGRLDTEFVAMGYADGQKFDPSRRLESA